MRTPNLESWSHFFFNTAALQDGKIEAALKINGVEEIVVYGCATGIPATFSQGEVT